MIVLGITVLYICFLVFFLSKYVKYWLICVLYVLGVIVSAFFTAHSYGEHIYVPSGKKYLGIVGYKEKPYLLIKMSPEIKFYKKAPDFIEKFKKAYNIEQMFKYSPELIFKSGLSHAKVGLEHKVYLADNLLLSLESLFDVANLKKGAEFSFLIGLRIFSHKSLFGSFYLSADLDNALINWQNKHLIYKELKEKVKDVNQLSFGYAVSYCRNKMNILSLTKICFGLGMTYSPKNDGLSVAPYVVITD